MRLASLPALRLVRLHNGLLAAAGVLIGAWWVQRPSLALPTSTLFAAVAAIALAAFANTVNDLYDVEIDRIVHPERPLPSGRIAPAAAWRIAAVSAAIALVASLAVRFELGALTAVILVVMFEYSHRLKAHGFIGNVIVAVLASLPFLYGGWSVGDPRSPLPLVALAVPLHLAREVGKDLEDVHGDAIGRRTLPVALGERTARVVMGAALGAFVAVLLWFARQRPLFALLALPALLCCALGAWWCAAGRRGGPALFKSAMVFALAALVASGG